MREVDDALARAYAQKDPGDHRAVPPAPHVSPARPDAPGGVAFEPPGVSLRWPPTVLALERDYGDRFERLADALIEARDQHHLRVLLFTSCHRAEGRTTLVLTLARALARRPGRTLLADIDLAGPMLARHLDLRPTLGLDDVVGDGQALADALVAAPDDHLTILPLRTAVPDPRGFLTGAAWSRVAARLRREFDLVLLDGGPLFAGFGTDPPHRGVDAAVLVLNRTLTGDRDVRRAREALEAAGVPLMGLAETFVN
jgi:Mrp family chromosome partitioning ATPase